MHPYRALEPSTPLVTAIGGHVMALDPERGSKLWAHSITGTIGRIAVVERSVFVAIRGGEAPAPSAIHVYDLFDGQHRMSTDLGFTVRHVLVHGRFVWMSNQDTVVCMDSQGGFVWRASTETVAESAWGGDTRDLVGRDATGRELWRMGNVPWRRGLGALALGELVSQPDFEP